MSQLSAQEKEFARPCPMNGYYDVYICFRGVDTRSGFSDTLYRLLLQSKIYTFVDAHLEGDITETLFEIIGRSRMAVVVYSERFASSYWCLTELAMIMQRWEEEKMLMIPIFYKVDVNELKYPTEKTIQYFDEHIKVYDEAVVGKWKDAVAKIGNVSGLSYEDVYTRSEFDFIVIHVIATIKKELREWKKTCEEESSTSKPYNYSGPAATKNHNVSKPWTSSSRMTSSSYGGIDTEDEEGGFKSSVTEMNAAFKRMGKLELSSNNQQQSNQAMPLMNFTNEVAEQFKGQEINVSNVVIKSRKNVFSRPRQNNGKYDVFLSFRGEDTRHGFTSNLYHALMENEVHTFMDIRLVGRVIDDLFEIIGTSKMAVVVYSKMFASSDWCLRELVLILQRMKEKKMFVIPIFYNMDVHELKHLTGNSGECLNQHVQNYGKTTVQKWKDAITTLSTISGISTRNRYEREFIKEVIDIVKDNLEDLEE